MNKILIFAFCVGLDQLAKYCATIFIPSTEIINILPFCNLCLYFNHGTSFGLLSNIKIILPVIAICIAALIYMFKKFSESRTTITIILAGAISNLIDRFTYGAVVDFIDLFIGQYHWPAFNLADVFISVGCLYLFLKK